MGGGDLNMKKSWHPLLLKNQERVWLEEKKALEEKKKLDQLRKEKEEERQLQELQRLQEEQTGKKRTEKLEWMYATPATGSTQNPNDLEDYLLGKKRVDKILTADDNEKLGASHKNFIAVQNANNARDIAAKIREDPLLAIKQQEQAAYQALLSNPLRLSQMQEKLGVKPKKDKKERKREKEERKREKKEKRRRRDSRSRSRSRTRNDRFDDELDHRESRRSPRYHSSGSRSRSPGPSRTYRDQDRDRNRYRQRSRSRSPRRSYRGSGDRYDDHDTGVYDDRREETPNRPYSSHNHHERKRSHSPGYRNVSRQRSPPPKRPRNDYSQPARPSQSTNNGDSQDDRAARLAAMTSNATSMAEERRVRLAALLEKEKAEAEADERERAKSKGMSNFLSQEQKRVFGGSGGLEDRIRRGRGGMVVDAD
ncbi:hypothetical protein CVT24_009040 [Panaeolus cyanescens]|uniref:CBF1-interacting co-repressor CIR N-terminal domain-containing protein n=1 Tax=Panaeolus cyanescens TaxID=181874 RepID=A0A409YAL1_9AGAR|nr:hypothetical protein CVT24_009040 [Panaeolus cyanescens]